MIFAVLTISANSINYVLGNYMFSLVGGTSIYVILSCTKLEDYWLENDL